MDEMTFLGYLIGAIITLVSFITAIGKLTQPINDLRLAIQKLNDNIDNMKRNDEIRDKRLDQHGEEIDALGSRVGKLETKMDVYHKE